MWFIETESADKLVHAPMHKILEYYFRYLTERPKKMIQYAISILSVFEKTPQPHVLHICEPVSNTVKTFSPFWKVFFYYFLTYFGFPTRKSRLIQDFLRSFIIHPTASLDDYLVHLLDEFLKKYRETESDQVIRERLADLINNGLLAYGDKHSVIASIREDTDSYRTKPVLPRFNDQLQTDRWYVELFFLVIQAMNDWKPKTSNLDVEFLGKWKRRIWIRNISYMTMDEFYHTDEITEDDLCYYSDYEKYEELCDDSESDGRDY